MTLPNFLIIGASKGGTTTLHYTLDQHPEVYMSPMKEPSFFWAYGREIRLKGPGAEVLKHRYVDDLDSYQRLFDGMGDEKAIGESSVRYLPDPRSPGLVHQFIPQIRLIASLRQPAERAFSSFTHYLRDGMEPCSDFGQAIAQERQGLREGWTFGRYLQQGFYYAALERYLQFFDRQQMHIVLFEDLREDPQGLMRGIFRFLEVDETFMPDLSRRHNVSGIIRNPVLGWVWRRSNSLRAVIRPLLSERFRHAAFEWFLRGRNLEKPRLSPDLRAELTEYYREDIQQLQDFLQRDLTHWLEAAAT